MTLRLIRGGNGKSDSESVEERQRRFCSAIRSESVGQIAGITVGRLINNPDYGLPKFTSKIVIASEPDQFGICVQIDQQGGARPNTPLLGVHANFPRFLFESGVLADSEEALQFAAVYARSYQVISDALRFAKVRRRSDGYNFQSSFESRLWRADMRDGNASVAPRAAGLVALSAFESTDVTELTEWNTALPNHLAGIANPLPVRPEGCSTQGFNRLSITLEAYTKHVNSTVV